MGRRPQTLLKYFRAKQYYSNEAFSILGKYFNSLNDFEQFIDNIGTDDKKDVFLRISSFYKYLVKQGRFSFYSPDLDRSLLYIDESYKFMALFSLIEALYAPLKHIDFYQYLMSRTAKNSWPLNKSQLNKTYTSYKNYYGSTRNIKKFFQSLDKRTQDFICRSILVDGKKANTVDPLVSLLYNIRSQFVHNAAFVLHLGKHPTVGYVNGKVVICKLSVADLSVIFEKGLLVHFGHQKS